MNDNTLTTGEQEEIRNYIRSKLGGDEIDFDRIPSWIAELEAENAKLQVDNQHLQATLNAVAEALLAVEWEAEDSYGVSYSCVWCHGLRKYGHKPDCQRQLALGLTEP